MKCLFRLFSSKKDGGETLGNKFISPIDWLILGQIDFLCTFFPNNFLLDSVALSGLLLKDFPSPPFSDQGVSKSYLIEMRRKRGESGRFTTENYQRLSIKLEKVARTKEESALYKTFFI